MKELSFEDFEKVLTPEQREELVSGARRFLAEPDDIGDDDAKPETAADSARRD